MVIAPRSHGGHRAGHGAAIAGFDKLLALRDFVVNPCDTLAR